MHDPVVPAQRAIGIPLPLFTARFALARTVGWMAQLNEMIADPEYKNGRPRQLFTGSEAREVTPIAQRQAVTLLQSTRQVETSAFFILRIFNSYLFNSCLRTFYLGYRPKVLVNQTFSVGSAAPRVIRSPARSPL